MTTISKPIDPETFEKAVEAALAHEKQAAIETFYTYLGVSPGGDLVLKHVPLMDIRWANIQMFANPECQLFAEQQYERWIDAYDALIADDTDADLSGLDDEDDEYSGASEWPLYDSDEAMFEFCADDDDDEDEE